MKKSVQIGLVALFGIVLLGLPQTASASHYSAGEVFYEYLGPGSQANSFKYRVYATIYRNVGGVPIGTGSLDACVFRASGGGTQNFQLNYIAPGGNLPSKYTMTQNNPYGWVDSGVHPNDPDGWDIPALDGCANSPKDISEYRYAAEVEISGTFPDWRFAISTPCCRDRNDNLAGSGNLYIEVELDNTKGQNSSPRIITPAARAFCILQQGQLPFEWFQTASESDGDSLRYGFDPDGSQDGQCGSPSPIPYSGSFSASAPLPSNPPVQINQRRGVFTLSPTQAGSYVVKIEVRELRLDTANGIYFSVGNTIRELQVPIANTCKASAEDGPKLDLNQGNITSFNFNATNMDSLELAYGVPIIKAGDSSGSGGNFNSFDLAYYQGYDCLANKLTLNFDIGVKCNTVVPTDFRLIGPDSVARPVDSIDTRCQVTGVSKTIDLYFHRSLDIDGNYLLQLRTGTDSNTIENECGYQLEPFYSALVEVRGCPDPEYQMDGATVLQDKYVRVDWSGNSDLQDSILQENFNQWNIYRAERGTRPFQLRGVVKDVNKRFWVDSMSDNGYYVDNNQYDYNVLLVYNGKGREQTNFCSNIVLRNDTPRNGNNSMALYWTPYNCIPQSDLRYNVYSGKLDTTNNSLSWQWDGSTTDTSYMLGRVKTDSVNQGTYGVKVTGRNPNGSRFTDSSTSNWIYYYVVWTPPEPEPDDLGEVIIPNVITPNGDGRNDRFYIQPPANGEFFEEISVTVYNRNGNLIFEDDNFESRNTKSEGWDATNKSGGKIPDGVYYYVIRLNDPVRGVSETKKGNITVMGNLF